MFVLGSEVSQEVWWPGAQGDFRSLRCAPLTVRTTFDELVVGLGVGALEGGDVAPANRANRRIRRATSWGGFGELWFYCNTLKIF
jgi:hypothetical protein